jgi:hypothetical protein
MLVDRCPRSVGFPAGTKVEVLNAHRRLSRSPNGEAEGPADHARQARRAHHFYWVPPRQADHASRPPPAFVRGRKHRSTVLVATVMRKSKGLQETNRASVRERNPRLQAEPPREPQPTASSRATAATERSQERQCHLGNTSARERTSKELDRRVFDPYSSDRRFHLRR